MGACKRQRVTIHIFHAPNSCREAENPSASCCMSACSESVGQEDMVGLHPPVQRTKLRPNYLMISRALRHTNPSNRAKTVKLNIFILFCIRIVLLPESFDESIASSIAVLGKGALPMWCCTQRTVGNGVLWRAGMLLVGGTARMRRLNR